LIVMSNDEGTRIELNLPQIFWEYN
jgi:hypothetical protein